MEKGKIKNISLIVLKYIFLLIILISSYMLLMMFASIIPSKFLTDHVKQSSETLEQEGERKIINLGYKNESLFTFTDALMINITYSATPKDPVASAMLGRKNYTPGQTLQEHIDSQYNLGASKKYINKKNGDLYQTKELYGLMHGENITDSFEYARYWHGYVVLLRPLLAITNYSGIRIIILILTTILVGMLLYKLYKKLDIWIALIFLIGLLSISIFVITQSINEILVFLVAITFSIILLNKEDLSKHVIELFFITGSITNFVDFLTAPLVTLSLPLIIYILLLQKENKKLKEILIEGLKACITWGLAYGLTWGLKWVLTQIIYGRPIIAQALEQARYRTGINENNLELKKVLKRNIQYLSNNVIYAIGILTIIYLIVKLIIQRKSKVNIKENLQEIIPFIITAVFPIIWYIALKEHSYIHAFFTYRIFIVTIISILIILYKLTKTDEKNVKMKR